MRKIGGGGLGFVVAVLALAIVLLLTAKSWNMMLPAAMQALIPATANAGTRTQGSNPPPANEPPASATRPSGMPDLKEMGQNTDKHIQQVKDAAAKQD